MTRIFVRWLPAALMLAAACEGGSQEVGPLPGQGGQGAIGGSGAGGGGGGPGCPDLFAPSLQTFSIDISAADWAAIQEEFHTVGQLDGDVFVQHMPMLYPVTFHYGSETVSDAFIHLRGDSSWREAVQFDGAAGKMQLSIVFDNVNPEARFHGVDKIKLDMPRTDPTFLHDRVGNAWLRSIGIPAVCATSARLMVNGALYGVYVAEESIGHQLVKEFFPGNSDGDLLDGGWTPQTNKLAPNHARQQLFWDATTPAALAAIVDVPGSLPAWAAEALLNDADGYWGGDHNFFIYDQGAKGYVFFPHDLDSTFEYLDRYDSDPITWWSVRDGWPLPIPQHYRIVIGDDGMRRQFVEALRRSSPATTSASFRGGWMPGRRRSRARSGRIRTGPSTCRRPTSRTPSRACAAGSRSAADYVRKWLACWDSGTGADADGDGVDLVPRLPRRHGVGSRRRRRDLRQSRSTTTATPSSTTAVSSRARGVCPFSRRCRTRLPMLRRLRDLLAAAALVLLLLFLTPAGAATGAPATKELVVFEAASLKDAFAKLARTFEKANAGVKVVANAAGSQELRAQIEHGAAADVMASADRKHMDALVKQGLVVSPSVFTCNEPVIVVRTALAASIKALADLPHTERIVIGTPEVPIGAYTLQILDKAAAKLGAGSPSACRRRSPRAS